VPLGSILVIIHNLQVLLNVRTLLLTPSFRSLLLHFLVNGKRLYLLRYGAYVPLLTRLWALLHIVLLLGGHPLALLKSWAGKWELPLDLAKQPREYHQEVEENLRIGQEYAEKHAIKAQKRYLFVCCLTAHQHYLDH